MSSNCLHGTANQTMSQSTIEHGTRTGNKHPQNQDAHGIRQLGDGHYLLALADGISAHRFGGAVARWFVARCLELGQLTSLAEQIAELHGEFEREFGDVPEVLSSGAAVCVAHVVENRVDLVWAGDCQVLLSRRVDFGYSTTAITPPPSPDKKLTAYFGRPGSVALDAKSLLIRPGDLLTLMTDGVLLDTQLLDSLLREDFDLTALVASVLSDSNRAANSDDATMIVYRHGQ
jgi:serine/threonine protein phosphatase PrpC